LSVLTLLFTLGVSVHWYQILIVFNVVAMNYASIGVWVICCAT